MEILTISDSRTLLDLDSGVSLTVVAFTLSADGKRYLDKHDDAAVSMLLGGLTHKIDPAGLRPALTLSLDAVLNREAVSSYLDIWSRLPQPEVLKGLASQTGSETQELAAALFDHPRVPLEGSPIDLLSITSLASTPDAMTYVTILASGDLVAVLRLAGSIVIISLGLGVGKILKDHLPKWVDTFVMERLKRR